MTDLRKGVYILPNLFTSASLVCGFYAVVHAIERVLMGETNFRRSVLFIFLAAFFDGLDGRVARRTRTATRFGVEYDSLADLASFGVAPAVVLYVSAFRDLGQLGWIVCLIYMVCGALRLARFNVQSTGVERTYFQGLPIPMAALLVMGFLLFVGRGRPIGNVDLLFPGDTLLYLLLLTLLVSAAMVSTIPYRSFKTVNLSGRIPFRNLVLVLLFILVWLTRPWTLFFLLGCAYLLSGPIEKYILPPPVRAYRHVRKRRRIKKSLERIDDIASGPPETPSDNVTPLRKP